MTLRANCNSAIADTRMMAYNAAMIRAVKLSLKFASRSKTAKIKAVLDRYRSCVNSYIDAVWEIGGSLNKETADLVPCGHLSFRQRAHALQQALGIVNATKASDKALKVEASCPVFRGTMVLSKQLVDITPAKASAAFDLWLRFSTLSSGNRIDVPLKGTKVLRKWLAMPGAVLKTGCAIGDRNGELFVIVWVEIPDLIHKASGKDLGIDIGINKLLATSDGKHYGKEIKQKMAVVRRRKPGSKGKWRARRTRDRYINETINRLPWKSIRFIAIEDLKGIKHGKSPKRGKQFRKVVAPWTAAYVLKWIQLKAQENRVPCVEVDPRYTSQTCPQCTHRASSNRSNEKFKCVSCGYKDDADSVGSLNILNRALGSVSSTSLARSKRP